METARHTPTGNWQRSGNAIHAGIRCVLTTHMEPKEQREADAEFVFRACKCHDELVDIARLVRTELEEKEHPVLYGKARALLARMEAAGLARAPAGPPAEAKETPCNTK